MNILSYVTLKSIFFGKIGINFLIIIDLGRCDKMDLNLLIGKLY